MPTLRDLGPFLSLVTSLDERMLKEEYASDQQNVVNDQGIIRPRAGYGRLAGPPGGFEDCLGFSYASGLSSAGVRTREYVRFDKISGTVRPVAINVDTAARADITDGATALSLHNSRWKSVAWFGDTYFFNNNESTYNLAKHANGTNTSFTEITPPVGPDPVTDLIDFQIWLDSAGTQLDFYDALSLVGVHNVDDITVVNATTKWPAAPPGDSITDFLEFTITAVGDVSITIAFDGSNGPGVLDWTYNDTFLLPVDIETNTRLHIAPGSWDVELVNNDPLTIDMETVLLQTDPTGQGTSATLWLRFPSKFTRTLKDNIGDIVIKFHVLEVDSQATKNVIRFGAPPKNNLDYNQFMIGGIDALRYWPALNGKLPSGERLDFSFAYRHDAVNQESAPGGLVVRSYRELWGFTIAMPNIPGGVYLGSIPRLTVNASADATVDEWTLYIRYHNIAPLGDPQVSELLKVAEYDEDTAGGRTQVFETAQDDGLQLAEWDPTQSGIGFADILCAATFSEWMVWGHAGGEGNVRHSGVANPEWIYTASQDPALDTRPANYSLSEGLVDDPVAMVQTGASFMIMGALGVYAQNGNRPWNMTTPQKLPASVGIIGERAFAAWRSDNGLPGVAYIGLDNELWFAWVSSAFGNRDEYRLVPMSNSNRGLIKSHLFNGIEAVDVNDITVGVDVRENALWLCYKDRAMEIPRPSLIDGERGWQPYLYSFETAVNWKLVQFADEKGIRSVRSTGETDEIKYEVGNSFALFGGAQRDGGLIVPDESQFWTSHQRLGRNRHPDHVYIDRKDLQDKVTIEAIGNRSTSRKQVKAGARQLRMGWEGQGSGLKYKIILPNNGSDIYGVRIQERPVGPRYAG